MNKINFLFHSWLQFLEKMLFSKSFKIISVYFQWFVYKDEVFCSHVSQPRAAPAQEKKKN